MMGPVGFCFWTGVPTVNIPKASNENRAIFFISFSLWTGLTGRREYTLPSVGSTKASENQIRGQ